MATKPEKLQNVDILNGGGVDSFLVRKGKGIAQLPASLLPQILTADKLLMPDKKTSIDRRLQQIGGTNLIDNPLFSINQRGVTSWTDGYGLDRYSCHSTTAYVVDQGVRVVSGAKAFSCIQQPIDYPANNGDVLTLSALVKGDSRFRLVIGRAYDESNAAKNIPASDDWELVSLTTTLSNLRLLVAKIDHPEAVAGDEIFIRGWKLEPGPFQTLAHQEGKTWVLNEIPNYTLELFKCKRYQRVFNYNTTSYGVFYGHTTSATTANVFLPVDVPMRANPAISDTDGSNWLCTVDGQTITPKSIAPWYASRNAIGIRVNGDFPMGKGHALTLSSNSEKNVIFDANL